MRSRRAHRGQAPRDTLLHPVWKPVSRGNPDEATFLARCLLGRGVVGASRRLSMVDLRVYAALGGLLREQCVITAADDPSLGHRDTRTVKTTGYQLLEAVAGSGKGGDHWKRLRRSLIRLADVRISVVPLRPIRTSPPSKFARATYRCWETSGSRQRSWTSPHRSSGASCEARHR